MKVNLPRGRGATWAWRVGASFVAACAVWGAAFPSCVERELSVALPAAAREGGWALEWRRAGDETFNGVWVGPGAALGGAAGDGEFTLTRRLPSYEVAALRLAGPGDAAMGGQANATLTVSALGRVVEVREGSVSPLAMGSKPGPVAIIDVDTSRPAWLHGIGVVALWVLIAALWAGLRLSALGLLWLDARLIGPVRSAAARRWGSEGAVRVAAWPWKAGASAVVVTAHVWAGVSSPLILTGDAVDYLTGANEFARTGSIAALPEFKAPLFPMILSIPFATGLDAFTFMRVALVVCGLLTSWLVYRAVREVASEWAGLVAGVVCGLSPVLITLEGYLLRETFAAAVVAAVALALARLRGGGAGRSMVGTAVALGLLAGMGALLRENFQTLLVILPAALILMPVPGSTWRSRAAAGGICLAVGLACVGPWYVHQAKRFDRVGMTLPKVNMNKAINAWSNGVLDLNQTRAMSYERWREAEERQRSRRFGDYEAVGAVLGAPPAEAPPLVRERPSGGALEAAAYVERVTGVLAEESVARAPVKQWNARLNAALSLTGLCSFPRHPSAPAMAWLSRPLRGQPGGSPTNMRTGGIPDSYQERWSRLEPLLTRHEVQLSEVPRSFTGWFDWLWRWSRPLQPVIAALSIAGFIASWKRRAWPIAALGLVIALNLLGAAWVVVTPTDRVAAPFIPGMVAIAAWAVWAWVAGPAGGAGGERGGGEEAEACGS